jgi:hypothetical protein
MHQETNEIGQNIRKLHENNKLSQYQPSARDICHGLVLKLDIQQKQVKIDEIGQNMQQTSEFIKLCQFDAASLCICQDETMRSNMEQNQIKFSPNLEK